MKKFLLLMLLLAFSGCIGTQQYSSSILTKMYADPSNVFINRDVTIYLDIENIDEKNLYDVYAEIFDTGSLSGSCEPLYENIMMPGQAKTLTCTLMAPLNINGNIEITGITSSTRFNKDFDIVQLIELVSENYYNIHLGEIKTKPKSYVYRDKNIEVDIEFSDNLPIVIRPEKKAFMYITIKNIGNGFLSDISKESFSITPVKENQPQILDCKFPDIIPTGRQLPRIACELYMPEGVDYIYNYDIAFSFNYQYEVRDQITVNIMK